MKNIFTWMGALPERGRQYEAASIDCTNITARELFKILVGLNDFVTEVIFLYAAETKAEAISIFCANYTDWSAVMAGNKIEVRRVVRFVASAMSSLPTSAEKRVVSLSIFGSPADLKAPFDRMSDLIECYVLAHHALFKGYELRIHHDENLFSTHFGDVLFRLQREGLVKLVYVGSHPGTGKCAKMLWRLKPVWDKDVDIVYCRDVDSLPTWRERLAVESFNSSWCVLGTIADNPEHGGVMGGLCQVRAKEFREFVGAATFEEFIDNAKRSSSDWARHGEDQLYLNEIVSNKIPHNRIQEQAIFRVQVEGKVTARVEPTIEGSYFSSELPVYIFKDISYTVKGMSDSFINYMGASGYRIDDALEFYREHSPIATSVIVAEDTTLLSEFFGWVGLSCDTNLDYAFYLPITCLVWQIRWHKPVVYLVGTCDEWLADDKLRLIVERTRETGAEIYWVHSFAERTSTTAQLARIFTPFADGVDINDYVLISDVDMLPVGGWVGHIKNRTSMQIYYANAYEGSDYEHYPMCYIGGTVSNWHTLLKLNPGKPIWRSNLFNILREAPKDASGAWNYDERWLGARIADAPKSLIQKIDRTFCRGEWRLDRSDWKIPENLDGIADAHLPRPGYGEHWPSVRELLTKMLTAENMAWVDSYYRCWSE